MPKLIRTSPSKPQQRAVLGVSYPICLILDPATGDLTVPLGAGVYGQQFQAVFNQSEIAQLRLFLAEVAAAKHEGDKDAQNQINASKY